MKRRSFLAAWALVPAYTMVSQAQQARVQHVAVLYGAPADATLGQQRAFEEALTALGHDIGQTVLVSHRGTNARAEDVTRAARDLIASDPDVIVAWSTVGAVAIKRTVTSLPVVFLSVGSPVEIGLVSSLSRPGGTMTGVAAAESTDSYGKRLQLLKELSPRMTRVAVLYAGSDPNGAPALEAIGRLGPSLGLQVLPAAIDSPQEIDSILRRLKQQAQGLLVISGGLTWTHRAAIATGALANRLPSAYGHPDNVAVGGLISLGTDLLETAR
jgi:putative ABC transport system substrate-binding protein